MSNIQQLSSLDQAPISSRTTAMQQYAFTNAISFDAAQRMAKCLAASTMVPKDYQNNLPNCVVALEVSQRTNSSVLMVMQNLAVIHGKPSWSSQYIIAALNSSGRFQGSLEFEITDEGKKNIDYELFDKDYRTKPPKTIVINKTATIEKNLKCYAYAKSKSGQLLKSPEVSIEMAYREGWIDKSGSKWKTMPELMLRYRAAAFFGRLYAPEILMGMQTTEEVIDIGEIMKDVTPIDESDNNNIKYQEINKNEQKKGNEGAKDFLKKTAPETPLKQPKETPAQADKPTTNIRLELGNGEFANFPEEVGFVDVTIELETNKSAFIERNKEALAEIIGILEQDDDNKAEEIRNLMKQSKTEGVKNDK